MYQRIIQIKSEIECIKVKQLLDTNNIPFESTVSHESSPFPTLNNEEVHHQIIFSDEHSSVYFKLIEKDYPTKLRSIKSQKEAKSKTTRWIPVLAIYGLLMSILFLKYYDINSRTSSDRNYRYSWSTNNKELNIIHKETNEVHYTYLDGNFNHNNEKITSYLNGIVSSESLDRNENGVYEEVRFFDTKGKLAGRSIDVNHDGLFDTVTFILEDRKELVLIDQNSNGLLEMLK